jgi:hypothetical protein
MSRSASESPSTGWSSRSASTRCGSGTCSASVPGRRWRGPPAAIHHPAALPHRSRTRHRTPPRRHGAVPHAPPAGPGWRRPRARVPEPVVSWSARRPRARRLRPPSPRHRRAHGRHGRRPARLTPQPSQTPPCRPTVSWTYTHQGPSRSPRPPRRPRRRPFGNRRMTPTTSAEDTKSRGGCAPPCSQKRPSRPGGPRRPRSDPGAGRWLNAARGTPPPGPGCRRRSRR